MKAKENIELVGKQVSEEEKDLKALLAELAVVASDDIQKANAGTYTT